jgi:hypothetical protein
MKKEKPGIPDRIKEFRTSERWKLQGLNLRPLTREASALPLS